MSEHKAQSMQEQFLAAHEEHADGIFRFCLFKVSHREVARDLTQDVFMKAWDYMAAGKQVQNLKALLYKIAGNLVIDYYRKRKDGSLDELLSAGFDPAGRDETARTDAKVDAEQVLEVLERLDPGYRDIIVLRFIEDMAVKDIAALYGEKENNISVKIYRALNQLREILKT